MTDFSSHDHARFLSSAFVLRMQTSFSAGKAKDYFTESLNRGDYYKSSQEMPGRWGGKAAETLGLTGDVKQEDFFDLCDNLLPGSKENLTPRTKAGRRVGYDINFHLPKSATLLFALGEDDRILAAFQESVSETMQDLEKEMRTRVRVDGQQSDRPTANMAWASFVHTTARPVGGIPDPHLHAHCFTFNLTHDPIEGRFKAGEFEQLKRKAPLFESRFHVRMAERMVALGYEVAKKGKFWEVVGVPPLLVDEFSRRTSEIDKLAKDLGIAKNAERKAGLGARTREKKQKGDSLTGLLEIWRERAGAKNVSLLAELKSGRRSADLASPEKEAKSAVEYAVSHCFERKSAVPLRTLQETAYRQLFGRGSLEAIDAEFSRRTFVKRELRAETWVTTKEVLAEEQRMIAFATETRGRSQRIFDDVYQCQDATLTDGQREAVRHVLNSYDQVMLIRGGAGTGKTRLMTEAIGAIERAGLTVQVLSPLSNVARDTLPKEGFNGADTVAKFLSSDPLQASVKNGLIWIDEAGLLGTRTMNELFEVAKKQGTRVVLSGDDRQHKSVDRGDGVRVLVEEAGMQAAEVRHVIRQTGKFKEACEHLNRGDVDGGWAILKELGSVVESKGKLGVEASHKAIAEQYAGALRSGKTVLAVSPTKAEGEKVTRSIREKLKAEGVLGKKDVEMMQLKPLHLTEAEKQNAKTYHEGLVIEYHQAGHGKKVPKRSEVASVKDGNVQLKGMAGGIFSNELDLSAASKFSVYEKSTISVAAGDTIRFTKNGKAAGDVLGFLPDRKNPLRGSRQLGREIGESLGLIEKQIRDNSKRVNNGATNRVIGILPLSGDLLMNNGYVLRKDHGHFTHAYCTTSPGAQSKTVDRVLVSQTSMSFGPASNAEQLLVSMSRGRERCLLFTDDADQLLREVRKSGTRISASEISRGSQDIEGAMLEQARLTRDRQAREAERARQRATSQRGRDEYDR